MRNHLARLPAVAQFWALSRSEAATLVVLPAAIGVAVGLAAVGFRLLIALLRTLLFETLPAAVQLPFTWWIALIPALGGLLVGLVLQRLGPEVHGTGVPQLMQAVMVRGGRIGVSVGPARALVAALTIGSGGSAGQEGPVVQIGGAIGSNFGQLWRLPEERLRTYVGCGVAAGIAAIFNTPIAGLFFALEVILGEFRGLAVVAVVLAAVTGAATSRVFLGDRPAFDVPPHPLVSPLELGLYLVLGLLAALVAVAFIRALDLVGSAFGRVRLAAPAKPAVGGLAVGVIGLWFPQVLGLGYGTIQEALRGQVSLSLLAALLVLKLAATSLTIGSGGAGGVIGPTLFLGAMLGGAFGKVAHAWAPTWTADAGAYAGVGSAAVFAAALHAPLTGVFTLFELTGDAHSILPLLAGVATGAYVAPRLYRWSIFTARLRAFGIEPRPEPGLLEQISVAEAMTPDPATVPPTLPLSEMAERFRQTGRSEFPVVDAQGDLDGIVTLSDLSRALERRDTALAVGDIATRDLLVAYPDEPVRAAIERLAMGDVGQLPVVDRSNPRRLLGLLRRSDVIGAYGRLLRAERARRRLAITRAGVEPARGTTFVEIDLSADAVAGGRRLRELALPAECVVVSIHRSGRVLIPRGDTTLLPGDHLTIYTRLDQAAAVRLALLGAAE
ncbi:MAG: chloride channel protein [Chloroflexi bacterium]|nr:chloride channel protein [Chloroflexota bacterium]